MRHRTFPSKAAAQQFIRESGLGQAPDRVTYSRQSDGSWKPIVHTEHYADAEAIEHNHQIKARSP